MPTSPSRTDLYTQIEAAEILGTDRWTIAGLVRAHGLVPKPIRLNGRAKGLDEADMDILRRALGRRKRRAASTA
jgi:hypothetical protein